MGQLNKATVLSRGKTLFQLSRKRFFKNLFGWRAKSMYETDDRQLPKSTRRIFSPNPDKKRTKLVKAPPISPLGGGPSDCLQFEVIRGGPRVNQLNIQMLSQKLYDQIFKNTKTQSCNPVILEECKRTLEKHGMSCKLEDYVPDVELELPPLEGAGVEEHFFNIGKKQAEPYQELVVALLKAVPQPPDEWIMQPGWTRYQPGKRPEPVPYPHEEALVFDIEVCMKAGKAPTLATAVSSTAWYGWVSHALIDGASKPITSHQYSLNTLIPLESTETDYGVKLTEFMQKPKIIIGHNVSYDRARIKEQYWLNRTGTRFLDTMSLHICVGGLTSYQRTVLKAGKRDDNDDNDGEDDGWKEKSSLNSLSDVHQLYCGATISKESRDLFVEGDLAEIKLNFQQVMGYCSGDVLATYNVLKKLFPIFLERFSHPVTLAGMLELSTAYLPVNNNWNRYIMNSEQAYDDLEIESRMLLARRADQACQLLEGDKYKKDLWLWDQDWVVKDLKMKKTASKKPLIKTVSNDNDNNNKDEGGEERDVLEDKFSYLWEMEKLLPRPVLLPGYPNWYRKLCTKPGSTPDWVPGPHLISTSMKITPKLLALTWEGYPLHYIRDKGWGFLIPYSDDLGTERQIPLAQLLEKCPLLTAKPTSNTGTDVFSNINKAVEDNLMRKEYYSKLKTNQTGDLYKGTGIWCNTELEDCCYFFKLPHKNGSGYNVGNPLAKDFLNKFSENVLAADTASAELILAIARKLSYWRNNRDRIFDQMLVWLGEQNLPKRLRDDGIVYYGAIIPQVVVCGTLTRRAVEPTWMTASNAHIERVGSELRAMVQAPPGFNMVGADVDSQELWIASVIGDAHHAKMHGATPFGWMTLSGKKTDGTDMHSVTAKAVGISRDHAKVLNYARIYGAGQNFAERLLKQFNPSMSEAEARSKATKMFTLTKGKRIFYLRKEYLTDFPDQAYTRWQATALAKSFGKSINDLFLKPRWVGGTESAMFNQLETIANSQAPKTPFLNCSLSRALEPPKLNADDRYLPTRVNWVVQSGAVDFLHLMLVCMRWLMADKARFCLSFHDEIRYIVPEKYRYEAALAMHVTNLLTRCFCSVRLDIGDLPQSVAFFSSVEVDTVLRKESKMDCQTPSNPHGLQKGFGIENGESLDIYEAVKKARGNCSGWYKKLRS